jgi:putative PIN family toxin of toxin-antitoxin system
MRNQRNRVIIDTNLWISFLLTKDFTKFDTIIADKKLVLLFSGELLDEIVEVMQRRKFRKFFSLGDIEKLLLQIRNRAEFIEIKNLVADCRDPKDNFLLSLSVDGQATHLITGDKDLLVLKVYGKTKILTITEYLQVG